MAFCAASVYEESKKSLSVLFSVPSESYCIEVKFIVYKINVLSGKTLFVFYFSRPDLGLANYRILLRSLKQTEANNNLHIKDIKH